MPAEIVKAESLPERTSQTAARALAPANAAPGAVSESAALLAVIERAARDPSIDIDKMERLMKMHEDMRARQAKAAFAQAFSELIANLPSIDRNGGIVLYSKADRDYAAKNNGEYPSGAKPIQTTKYATLDDILAAINPVLSEYGFSIRFEHVTAPVGESYRIVTRAILTHKDGHSESAETPPLMQDSGGSKNNVQSVGSSMKYGRRYALMAVLPIVSHAPQDADDDGRAAGSPTTIDEGQIESLQRAIIDADADLPGFLKYFRVEKLDDLLAKDFDRALDAIKRSAEQRKVKK